MKFMNLSFKNYNDLYFDILDWNTILPRDFDTVIGIPRSGMIVAFMLSQIRNIRMGSINSLLSNNFEYGHRIIPGIENPISKILVVDDTLKKGRTLIKTRSKLKGFEVSYGVVYITQENKNCVDFFYKILPPPRPFLWNVFHSLYLDKMCVDIDDVLCLGPTKEQDDDSFKYEDFVKNATPLYIPTCPIHSIVSSRLEKYMNLTKIWLKKYNIQYQNLILSPYKTQKEKRDANNSAQIKAAYYKYTKTELFIESNPIMAKIIKECSGKPVLCTKEMELV